MASSCTSPGTHPRHSRPPTRPSPSFCPRFPSSNQARLPACQHLRQHKQNRTTTRSKPTTQTARTMPSIINEVVEKGFLVLGHGDPIFAESNSPPYTRRAARIPLGELPRRSSVLIDRHPVINHASRILLGRAVPRRGALFYVGNTLRSVVLSFDTSDRGQDQQVPRWQNTSPDRGRLLFLLFFSPSLSLFLFARLSSPPPFFLRF